MPTAGRINSELESQTHFQPFQGPLKPDELMKAMGSKKGYSPMPVEQHTVDLYNPNPVIRLRAWIWSKTLLQGHRCPWCVDEHGFPITLEVAATEFSWTLRYTRYVFAKLGAMGVAREDEDKKILLCGTVPQAPPPQDAAAVDDPRFDVESLPTYIKQQIQQLSRSEQDSLLTLYPSHIL